MDNHVYDGNWASSSQGDRWQKINLKKIDSLTYDLMIAKADIDFNTNIEKREYAARLEDKIKELLK